MNNSNDFKVTGTIKIRVGICIIFLSPLLGTLLSDIYVNFVGSNISTDQDYNMFWVVCMSATLIGGIALFIEGIFCRNKE